MTQIHRKLPISAIELDRTLPVNPRTLALVDYLRSGGRVPEIHVERYEGGYRIRDGRHRITAYKLLGWPQIDVRYGVTWTQD
jgi:ParB-like chromosome segregation protein Spo0J